MNRRSLFGVIILCGMFFASCATSPKFDGTANLTGLIVDENNQPVYGFLVAASSGLAVYESAMTNQNGIFVIQNVDSGKISFSGKKDGYAFLDCDEIFCQRDKIFCFQVVSADAVLDKVDAQIIQNDYDGSLAMLKTISAKWGSPLHGVVCEYEKYCKSAKKMERQNKSKTKDGEDEKV